jgi:5,5'-dehydrodivanillate O-demethylase oxygenase subunit
MAATVNGNDKNGKPAWTRENYTDFAHVGPEALAGQYLRRFWHPIYRSEDLQPGRAKPVRLLGEDFTLYRGEGPSSESHAQVPSSELGVPGQGAERGTRNAQLGTPHLLAFRCAHRGTQLSTGWVEGDNLRCFYHGWMYDGAGQCVEQPAEPEPFCQKIRIRGYPVRDYLGLVFAYIGDGEPPELPRYPEFENDEEVREVVIREPWPCNYFNRIENAPDLVHLTYTHYQFGFKVPTKIEAVETDYGMETRAEYPDGKVQQVHFIMPTLSRYDVEPWHPSETRWRERIGWRVPIDDTTYVDVLLTQIHLTGDDKEQFLARSRARDVERAESLRQIPIEANAVLSGEKTIRDVDSNAILTEVEDYATLVGQGSIADRPGEHLGRTDIGLILIRKMYSREMRALAEGQPLTEWRVPDSLDVVTAVV